MLHHSFILALALLLVLATLMLLPSLAFDVTGVVVLPPQIAKHPPYAPIKLSLNGDQAVTHTRADGSFAFYNLPLGSYRLDVLSTQLMFPQLLVDITEVNGQQAIQVFEVAYMGAKKVEVEAPIVLQPQIMQQYFQPRPSFSIWGMVKGNPMMVMMVVSMGFMFLMPKMMPDMNSEEMKKIQKEMKENPSSIEGMLSNFLPTQ